jgi:hypothetical protein
MVASALLPGSHSVYEGWTRRTADASCCAKSLRCKNSAIFFGHTVRMPDEHSLTLQQIGQARGDLYAIESDIHVVMSQLARLPTRKDMARIALLASLTTAALVLAWIETLFR